METRKHIQSYRTSGTTQPSVSDILYGEIALGYKRFNEKLFIKNTSNTITEFSSDEQLKDVMNGQDIKIAEATGLNVNNVLNSGEIMYEYQPGSEVLAEFTNLSDAVDYLANQLRGAYDIINELKSNIYVIETNFEVDANTAVTEYSVSYSCMNNGNPTTPSACTITKYSNDGSGTVILNNTGTPSASTTTNITGNKEQFVLEVVPNLAGALNIRSELTRYLCYVGASTETTMTSALAESFHKYVSDGVKFTAEETTTNGQYLWFIVPSYISIQYVTSNAITFALDTQVQTISNSLGSFKCYRSYMQLDSATWPLVIHNIAE